VGNGGFGGGDPGGEALGECNLASTTSKMDSELCEWFRKLWCLSRTDCCRICFSRGVSGMSGSEFLCASRSGVTANVKPEVRSFTAACCSLLFLLLYRFSRSAILSCASETKFWKHETDVQRNDYSGSLDAGRCRWKSNVKKVLFLPARHLERTGQPLARSLW